MTDNQAEPLEQQLDDFVRDMVKANQLSPSDAAMLATVRDVVAAEPDRAIALAAAQQQRDFLGDQVRRRIERFHGLRVAHGDIEGAALAPLCQQEIGALQGALAQMEPPAS